MRYTAFIGLGSNLASPAGTPEETVQAAFAALVALGSITACSSLYRTAPVGLRDQPDFINAVARLETAVAPEELLRRLLDIERQFGRDREKSVPKGPRTLDLDLLLMLDDGRPVLRESPGLTLPHPTIAARRFVLEPLAEIDPGLTHPARQRTIHELLQELLREFRANETGAPADVTRLGSSS
jgi:2-amino-4-hydroxy-6-hydroxymethyldihydropteridine diphosphokinase